MYRYGVRANLTEAYTNDQKFPQLLQLFVFSGLSHADLMKYWR